VSPLDLVIKRRELNEQGSDARASLMPPVDAALRLASLKAEIDALGDEAPLLPPQQKIDDDNNLRAQRLFAPVDFSVILCGFVLAWLLAAAVNNAFFGRALPDFWGAQERFRWGELGCIVAGVLIWFEHTGHYRSRMPFWHETQQIVSTFGFAMLIDGFSLFAAKEDFSRTWLMSGWVLAAGLLVLARGAMRKILQMRGKWQIKTVVVGAGSTAAALRRVFAEERSLGFEIVRQIDFFAPAWKQAGRSWKRLCEASGASYVMFALDDSAGAPSEEAMAQISRENVPFSFVPAMSGLPVFGIKTQAFFNHNVMLMSRSSNLEQPLPRIVKRTMDIVVSSIALTLLSPVLALLAALVALDGGAPVYGHWRIGMSGRRFRCWKFRSMVMNGNEILARYLVDHADARAEWLSSRKLRRDPRVTAVGRVLRRLSLDELPQLYNVLRGDMSLVGPRPIVIAEAAKYDHDIAHYYRVRPGITGLWQISGRSDVSYAERVRMDSWYVRNWSLWNDIAILFKTLPALVGKTGAY